MSRLAQVYFIFALADLILKFCKNLTGPCGPALCPAPTYTYLPTYLTYGKLKKKSRDG